MTEPLVSVQIVVRNGQKYLRQCLNSVHTQTYKHIEVVVLDNASKDGTADTIAEIYPEYKLIRHEKNLGMWPGHEFLLAKTTGSYVLALSIDVILDPHFIEHAVAECEHDTKIAAVQAKVYRTGSTRIIDTCGFELTRGRMVRNIGHGEQDGPTYSKRQTVFGVEGAVPFFRRSALEDCRIEEHIWDPDFFWYGDDLDLAWRMTLFGHKQVFLHDVIAWHDRSTTKSHGHGIRGTIQHVAERRSIPLKKRQLDWVNVRCTIVKNDAIINILRDLPWILWRELMVIGYMLLFEPRVFLVIPRFFRLLPTMLRRRKIIMHRIQRA